MISAVVSCLANSSAMRLPSMLLCPGSWGWFSDEWQSHCSRGPWGLLDSPKRCKCLCRDVFRRDMASWIAMTFAWKTLQWSGRRNETLISSTRESLVVKLGTVCVYIDGVFDLVWEVVSVCTGRYEDLELFFEADYGWNVVCNAWYGYLIC